MVDVFMATLPLCAMLLFWGILLPTPVSASGEGSVSDRSQRVFLRVAQFALERRKSDSNDRRAAANPAQALSIQRTDELHFSEAFTAP
jgi:hypothetical protein